jgi:tetratricopeptide (TPR) repeat protein
MDPDGQYQNLRSEHVAREELDKPDRLEALVEGWSDRVDWWRNPLRKTEVWKKILNFFGIKPSSSRHVDSLNGGLEEVIVTGIRASGSVSPIIIEAWNSNQPYLAAIKNSQTPLEEYYNQRIIYGKSPAFYMDVSKHFFKENKVEVAIKVLSNILELLPERLPLERMVAYILLENGSYQDALELFSLIDEIVPYQANSKRDLAIAWEQFAVKEKDRKALDKAAMFYYRSAMESKDDVEGLPLTSIMELNRLLAKNKGKVNSKKIIDTRLIKNLPLDLRVVLTWSSNLVDLDLHVIEPSGEEVFYSNSESKQGGYLPYDDVTGFGPEEYLLKNAKSGEYQVVAEYFGGQAMEAFGEVYVKVDFYHNFAKRNERHESTTIRLEYVKDEMLVGKFVIP